ncbi:MAG: hypothetical protein EHM49_07455 [Deltaproteobacteria bacterium]|nr:MAG: hypothetical protein EHM49_07455 [Deltaproteobacteria bacterium]
MSKIIKMAEKRDDGNLWTPEQMLEDAADRARAELSHIRKALVLFWDQDTSQPERELRWSQSGLTKREILKVLNLARDETLLEIAMNHTHRD